MTSAMGTSPDQGMKKETPIMELATRVAERLDAVDKLMDEFLTRGETKGSPLSPTPLRPPLEEISDRLSLSIKKILEIERKFCLITSKIINL